MYSKSDQRNRVIIFFLVIIPFFLASQTYDKLKIFYIKGIYRVLKNYFFVPHKKM